ncbi:Efflux RND transporter periplasmic adaptor subunit [Sulfidibacter corallicola]|uniref:Efflux RND transporter periplasmic adaptor subunit n=1 Tax=Sulfidibacter corallicola TaxID=2818388 RepID=A0A8A4TQ43_SULCO|nr:efflux RND transporter periplasmic adaptor subunit [Sulfidibacter corallicola]QTD51304.1 efflux RND transporter periplasmic adaptor subunit [Sulfidibacter corallicola]
MNSTNPMKGVVLRLALASLLASAACNERKGPEVYSVEIRKGPFEIVVQAEGKLRAVRTTPIKPPPQIHQGVIKWLIEEGTEVAPDQVVVRLDDSKMTQELTEAEAKVAQRDLEIGSEKRTQAKAGRELTDQVAMIGKENDIAQRFALKDEHLFSRSDLIDNEIDLALLEAKKDHYGKLLDRQEEKRATTLDLLAVRRRIDQSRVNRLNDQKAHMEIRAPHAGAFYYKRNWRGEAPSAGMTIWSMSTIGEIPDLSEMEAVVSVLESEAQGIAEGREVLLELDAAPGRVFRGAVRSISPLAQAIDHDSPVKFFETIVALEHTDPDLMIPGGRVRARIFVARLDEVVAVPNQSLFSESDQTWVHVIENGRAVRREVVAGTRGPSRTVIVEGMQSGDRIALADPEESAP